MNMWSSCSGTCPPSRWPSTSRTAARIHIFSWGKKQLVDIILLFQKTPQNQVKTTHGAAPLMSHLTYLSRWVDEVNNNPGPESYLRRAVRVIWSCFYVQLVDSVLKRTLKGKLNTIMDNICFISRLMVTGFQKIFSEFLSFSGRHDLWLVTSSL